MNDMTWLEELTQIIRNEIPQFSPAKWEDCEKAAAKIKEWLALQEKNTAA